MTTSDGRDLSGSVLSVSASVLEMTGPGGERSMPLSDVRTIETRASLKNGAQDPIPLRIEFSISRTNFFSSRTDWDQSMREFKQVFEPEPKPEPVRE